MRQKKIKFVFGAIMIVMAIGFLIASTINNTSTYFMTVAELMTDGATKYTGAGLKIKGNVVAGSIHRNPGDYLDVAFQIEEKKSVLKVIYNGVTPDMFADGREVVVEGTLSRDGVFHANTLLTSCPSKYEAEKEKGKTHPGSMPDMTLKAPKPETNTASVSKT